MKKTILLLALLSFSLFVKSQNTGVEKSTFGVQAGLLGVWVHNEARVGDKIAIRSEIGLTAGLFGGSRYYNDNTTGILAVPIITVEPRWYYNLNKRAAKAKNTADNGGNFLSFKTSYIPDWFVLSNYDNLKVVNQLTFIPTWGIRRNIGQHFNYEAGVGIGYGIAFAKSTGATENESEVAANLHLRIGYKF